MCEEPSPSVFCGFWRYDIEDTYWDALLFDIRDILRVENIKVWDRLSTSFKCEEEEGKTSIYDLEDTQIRVALSCVPLLPEPIRWNMDNLPMALGSRVLSNDIVTLASILCDCISLTDGKGRTAWMPADFFNGVPMKCYDDSYATRSLAEYEVDVRRSLLLSYVELYNALLEAKKHVLKEFAKR